MRLILARVLFNFDMELSADSQNWIADQKIYSLWRKTALNVHLNLREDLRDDGGQKIPTATGDAEAGERRTE